MDDESQGSALAKVQELGLTITVDEFVAARIKAQLMIVEGRFFRGVYHRNRDPMSGTPREPYHDAYDAIAQEIVTPFTPDNVLTDDIPRMVHTLHLKGRWMPRLTLEIMTRWLEGSVTEWKGKRTLMSLAGTNDTPKAATAQLPASIEPTYAQLRRLREESHIEFEPRGSPKTGQLGSPQNRPVETVI